MVSIRSDGKIWILDIKTGRLKGHDHMLNKTQLMGKTKKSYTKGALTYKRHSELVDFIMKNHSFTHKGKKTAILDVGCGESLFLGRLDANKFELTGCDWKKPKSMENNVRFVEIDLNKFDLCEHMNNKFQIITCSDVLEHLENPARVIRSMAKLLDKDGTLFITLPNATNIVERLRYLFTGTLRRYRSERVSGKFGHISFFNKDILESLFDRANCDIVDIAGGAFLGHFAISNFWISVPPSTLFSYNIYIAAQPKKGQS